jgi:hypothetical protein
MDRRIEIQFELESGNAVTIHLSEYSDPTVADLLLNGRVKAVEVRERRVVTETRTVRFNVN